MLRVARRAEQPALRLQILHGLQLPADVGERIRHHTFVVLHTTLDGDVNNPINKITGQSFVNRRRMLDYSKITIVDTDFGSAMVTQQESTPEGKDVYTLGIPYW